MLSHVQDIQGVKKEDDLALLGKIKKSKLIGVLKSTPEFNRLKEKGKGFGPRYYHVQNQREAMFADCKVWLGRSLGKRKGKKRG